MRYWWVNQKQTFKHELHGGYIWSPKRNRNGVSNRAYEAMRTIIPGDCLFSFAGGKIMAIGFACSYCYEFPKPTEFGKAGDHWNQIGWRVDINYREISSPIRPKEHIEVIRPLLPSKYSPLQANGNGNQTFYLYNIEEEFAFLIAQLIDHATLDLVRGNVAQDRPGVDSAQQNLFLWENAIEKLIAQDMSIPETNRETLLKARRGQGEFRNNLLKLEPCCRLTRVDKKEHLIASHTKPWRDCNNTERMDPENGFMLTPSMDHLFDRGFISFDNNGDLLVSPVAHTQSLENMGVSVRKKVNVGGFSEGQMNYLEWHRNSILLASQF